MKHIILGLMICLFLGACANNKDLVSELFSDKDNWVKINKEEKQ